ncbi:hypothetical protein I3760_16G013800 [Carya illinoinensis]|nr:hypothetical protein I3760_16G013800 [Carya illinoinensis]
MDSTHADMQWTHTCMTAGALGQQDSHMHTCSKEITRTAGKTHAHAINHTLTRTYFDSQSTMQHIDSKRNAHADSSKAKHAWDQLTHACSNLIRTALLQLTHSATQQNKMQQKINSNTRL